MQKDGISAFLDKKLAIEYEGIFGGGKSRHTTVSGYTGDVEKYNAAQSLGWTVLRISNWSIRNILFSSNRNINERMKFKHYGTPRGKEPHKETTLKKGSLFFWNDGFLIEDYVNLDVVA